MAYTCETHDRTSVSITNSISKHNYLFLGWLNLRLHNLVGYRVCEDWKSKSISSLMVPIQIISLLHSDIARVILSESSCFPPSSIESNLYWRCCSLCVRDGVMWDPGVPPHSSCEDKAITFVPFNSWKKLARWGAQSTPTAFNKLLQYTKYCF